jgi:hypothetical protein
MNLIKQRVFHQGGFKKKWILLQQLRVQYNDFNINLSVDGFEEKLVVLTLIKHPH